MAKPRMTKAHYNLLSDAIRNIEYKTYDYVIQDIATALIGTNPKFDPQFFIDRCYENYVDFKNNSTTTGA
jgi:hypothetical protein